MIDRRALITGLATLAVARVAPALSVTAASGPTRWYAGGRLTYASWSLTPHSDRYRAVVKLLLGSTWHFQRPAPDAVEQLWYIRHLATGATFRQFDPDPDFPDSAVLDFAYVETPLIAPDLDIHTLGFAANAVVGTMYWLCSFSDVPLFGNTAGACTITHYELPADDDPDRIPVPIWSEDVSPLEGFAT